MNDKNKIDSLQTSILIYFLARAAIFGVSLNRLEKIAHQDAWISSLIGTVIGLIPLFIYLFISKKYPESNIIEVTTKLFGKIIGNIINIIIISIAFLIGIVILTNLIKFIQTNLLVNTPALVIGLLFLFPAYLAASRGIEVFTRVGLVLFLASIGLFFLAVIGLSPYIELDNIKPYLEHGTVPILKGTIYYISTTIAPLFLILIIPRRKIVDKERYNNYAVKWYLFTSLTIFIIIFWCLSVLGPKLVHLYNFPAYAVLKKISFLNFIERVENNVIWDLALDSFITIVFSLYFISESSRSIFNAKKEIWSHIIIIVSALSFLLIPTFIIPNKPEVHYWLIDHYGVIIGIIIFTITLIIFIRSLFDKKQAT